ncbi:hypothetical protein T484DRAFT_1764322 [Baffinella frigidus]|nr:hypothetical protein T484DRAFT_1764322 [Cryptophyta sp. CCMP2293]
MQEQGFDVLHVYGLTETYGPAVVCEWKQEWNSLSTNQQAKIRSRQGVNYPVLEDLQVMDPETMIQVPTDGETLGEVMMRGNMVPADGETMGEVMMRGNTVPADGETMGEVMMRGNMVPADGETMGEVMMRGNMVPADGETMGEVMMRGNMVMKGYLDNDSANSKDLKGGWYHSGDLGVMHPDGYIELKDRSKDIIISGGENISSIEIEAAIFAHPSVNLAAVVAKPDDKWGEVPCAFIEFHKGQEVSVEVMIAHCRKNLAGFMVPKAVVFAEISKTSTGKVQKFKMREIAKETPLLK